MSVPDILSLSIYSYTVFYSTYLILSFTPSHVFTMTWLYFNLCVYSTVCDFLFSHFTISVFRNPNTFLLSIFPSHKSFIFLLGIFSSFHSCVGCMLSSNLCYQAARLCATLNLFNVHCRSFEGEARILMPVICYNQSVIPLHSFKPLFFGFSSFSFLSLLFFL